MLKLKTGFTAVEYTYDDILAVASLSQQLLSIGLCCIPISFE